MHHNIYMVCPATLMFSLVSCQSSSQCDRSLKPEAQWNELGIWRRVSDKPPSYIPSSYSVRAPRTDHDGTWLVDRRDGKRLFVPDHSCPPWNQGTLFGEAKKVTDTPEPRTPRTFEGSIEDGTTALLQGTIMALASMGSLPMANVGGGRCGGHR